ncbi:MAG TPA: branched-chain amino acid aminotransferase [Bacillus sp. (in: firmicutes)]|nr:branched-chain amino acid aminotransferase [Bacillus sp. (in: firmicutes)]
MLKDELKQKASERFMDAHIERVHKETDELIAEEAPASFLKESIQFLKQHKSEFIYLESESFDLIRVDAISLELDDMFGFYNVMLGLKLQKKYEQALKTYLSTHLDGPELRFGAMFNQGDGLWDLNFALNYVEGFKEEMSIGEAYQLIYEFLSQLVEEVQEEK